MATLPLFAELPPGEERLAEARRSMASCVSCVHHAFRTRVVSGQGNPERPLLAWVVPPPSAQSDKTGQAVSPEDWVLYEKMAVALGCRASDFYYMPAAFCRDRYGLPHLACDPKTLRACAPNRLAVLRAINPYVIVAVGEAALRVTTAGAQDVLASRGNWRKFGPWDMLPTLDPSMFHKPPKDRERLAEWQEHKALFWEDVVRAYDRACGLRRAGAQGVAGH